MSSQRHRIHRQVFELTVGGPQAAGDLHAQLSRLQADHATDHIERCLNELGDPDRLQRIDRLEIDLGALAPHNLERQIIDKLGRALPEALSEKPREGASDAALVGEDPAVTARLELLLHFAQTGSFPWLRAAMRRLIRLQDAQRVAAQDLFYVRRTVATAAELLCKGRELPALSRPAGAAVMPSKSLPRHTWSAPATLTI